MKEIILDTSIIDNLTKLSLPKTNYFNKDCYANHLNDCNKRTISEHFMPETGLARLFSSKIILIGWLSNNVKEQIIKSASKIYSPILCERHNSILGSKIDVSFRTSLNTISDFYSKENIKYSNPNINKQKLFLLMLQMGCGFIAHYKRQVPKEWIEILFSENQNDYIIYTNHNKMDYLSGENHLNLKILNSNKNGNSIGILLEMKSFRFAIFPTNEVPEIFFQLNGIKKLY